MRRLNLTTKARRHEGNSEMKISEIWAFCFVPSCLRGAKCESVLPVLTIVAVLLFATSAFAQAPRLASEGPPDRTTAPQTPPENGSKISFLNLLTRGGWAMIPLAACSLLGLALIIERAVALRRSQIAPAGFMQGLQDAYGRDNVDQAIAYCDKHPSALARVMAAAVRKMPEGSAAAEGAIADQGVTEVARLRRNLRLLHGIAAITPTLGLLGTVWGMIRAFEAASRMGLGSHSETLTTGIYEALVATMTGLMIAVPVLLFYYIYLGIIDRAVLELNDQAFGFINRNLPRRTETQVA